MKKRIAIFTNHFYPEQFRINDIALELVKKGYDVTVITQVPNYPSGKFFDNYSNFNNKVTQWEGIKIKRLSVIPRGKNSFVLSFNYLSYALSSFFYGLFTRDKFDCIFTYQTSPIFLGRGSNVLSKRLKVKHIFYVLDVWPKTLFTLVPQSIKLQEFFTRISKKIYGKADEVLISSKGFVDELVTIGVEKDKITYWPQYPEDLYEPILKQKKRVYITEKNCLNFVFTGNVGKAQGLDALVFASNELKKRNIDVCFNIVGDGRHLSSLQELIESYHVEEYFDFHGRVPVTEIPLILSEADVALLTLDQSDVFELTLPAKVQSYMACSMPILVAATGISSITIEEAQCGLVGNSNDVERLVSNVIEFTTLSKEDLAIMSENAHNYGKMYFDKSTLINQLISKIETERK